MHKYPFLYQQCTNTFGYDDMIKRLGDRIFMTVLDTNCMRNSETILVEEIEPEKYNELIDFLDGNGFIIKPCNNSFFKNKMAYHIIPIEKENIK